MPCLLSRLVRVGLRRWDGMGWPEHNWADGGLHPARRRALLSALDPAELVELVSGEAADVEQNIRRLLKMFDLGLADYTKRDVVVLAKEAAELYAKQMEADGGTSAEGAPDPLAHFDYTTVPRKHVSRHTAFREKGEQVARNVGVLTTRIGQVDCLLLSDGIILVSSLYLAHVTQARAATVEFYWYKGSPVPPLVFRIDAKRLLAVGMGGGVYFGCNLVGLPDAKTVVVEVLPRSALLKQRANEYFPAGVYLEGDLQVGSIVSLTASEQVLLQVVSDNVADGTVTLTAVHGTHGITDMPPRAYGIVHRQGTAEAYTVAAIEPYPAHAFDALTSAQQACYEQLMAGGVAVVPRAADVTGPGSVAADGASSEAEIAMVQSDGPAAPTPHGAPVTAAAFCPAEGVVCKVAVGPLDAYLGAPEPAPGFLFDLEWNVVGVVPPMTRQYMAFPSVVLDMKERGFVDLVRGAVVQGDGLLGLSGGAARRGRSTPAPEEREKEKAWRQRRQVEAERLEWGEKGLALAPLGGKVLDLPCILDDDDGSPRPLTLPPFSVVLLDKLDEIDIAASREAEVTINVAPAGYRLANNTTTMIRGEAVFYHMRVYPPPTEPFHLTASVAISYTGTLRYPLQKRHVMPKYNAVASPPIESCSMRLCGFAPTEQERALLVERHASPAPLAPSSPPAMAETPHPPAHRPTPPSEQRGDTSRGARDMSLFRRLGGGRALAQVVHSVLARIGGDTALVAALFPQGAPGGVHNLLGADAERHIVSFLTAHTGGPGGADPPPPLPFLHLSTRAATQNWAACRAHVEDALEALRLERREHADVLALLDRLKAEHLEARAAVRGARQASKHRAGYPHSLYPQKPAVETRPRAPIPAAPRSAARGTSYPTGLYSPRGTSNQ